MNTDARQHAMRQWNATACGELSGDKDSLEYFQAVERDRYAQQRWMADYFDFPSFRGKTVLEIGTGQGTDLIQFARAGARCIGVDITENHLRLTSRNFQLQGHSIQLFRADATQLPLASESVDCVYSFGVIHHIPEASSVLAEIRRVLKPGGLMMLALYYRWSAFHLFTKLLCHGVGHGWLWSKGYDGLLATIESGADGESIKPYVRLYSRADVRRLVRGLQLLDLSVHQLESDHFYPAVLGRMLAPVVPRLDRVLGWYVVCKAVKALRD
jgi:ubiquinone/menaquinone biosynthesis C-methylase UbiE